MKGPLERERENKIVRRHFSVVDVKCLFTLSFLESYVSVSKIFPYAINNIKKLKNVVIPTHYGPLTGALIHPKKKKKDLFERHNFIGENHL